MWTRLLSTHPVETCETCVFFFTGAQPNAGTSHKMQTVSVVLSTLHCWGYIADLTYIAGSLGPGKFHVVVLVFPCDHLV